MNYGFKKAFHFCEPKITRCRLPTCAQWFPVLTIAVSWSIYMVKPSAAPSLSCMPLAAARKITIEEIEAWWVRTAELVRDAELAPLTWIFIDANAPLASHDCA